MNEPMNETMKDHHYEPKDQMGMTFMDNQWLAPISNTMEITTKAKSNKPVKIKNQQSKQVPVTQLSSKMVFSDEDDKTQFIPARGFPPSKVSSPHIPTEKFLTKYKGKHPTTVLSS